MYFIAHPQLSQLLPDPTLTSPHLQVVALISFLTSVPPKKCLSQNTQKAKTWSFFPPQIPQDSSFLYYFN